MAEQFSHMMSRVNETNDVGSHLTRFRRYRDERTGHYVLSVDGSPYSIPLTGVSEPQPPLPTGRSTHKKQSYTAALVPVFPAGLQRRTDTEDAGSESGRLIETSQSLEFAPTWAGMQLKQTEVTTIGREPGADLLINHPTVSRRHAQIACMGQRYVLHDLGSKNGTFVNDTRLKPDKVWVLNPSDRIRFGKGMVYIFQVHSAESVEHMNLGVVK